MNPEVIAVLVLFVARVAVPVIVLFAVGTRAAAASAAPVH